MVMVVLVYFHYFILFNDLITCIEYGEQLDLNEIGTLFAKFSIQIIFFPIFSLSYAAGTGSNINL